MGEKMWGKYHFNVGQEIRGEDGIFTITAREKKKDCTENAIERKWYTLKCPEGHVFQREESHIENRPIRCMECIHPKIAAVDDDFAKLFVNREDTLKYTCMSHVKADFYCPTCGNICKEKAIHTIYQRGYVPCDRCGDGRSTGERFIAALLEQLKIRYRFQKRIIWNKQKYYYDFELPDEKALIEVHGIQHYGRGFEQLGGRTLEEEKKNDIKKRDIAERNGYKYIAIDARKSDYSYLRNSVEGNSDFMSIVDIENVNWPDVYNNTNNSKNLVLLKMLIEGVPRKEIMKKTDLSSASISNYKRKFIDLGMWDGVNEKEKKIKEEITKLDIEGVKSGDICKRLNLNPGTFKRILGVKKYPNPKCARGFTNEEITNYINEKGLSIKLLSPFINRRTSSKWECTNCGNFFEATLESIEKGERGCSMC